MQVCIGFFVLFLNSIMFLSCEKKFRIGTRDSAPVGFQELVMELLLLA
jgi:hypothetical protein